jgi:pimeloyl-ACP methyl ester carboxylesterase
LIGFQQETLLNRDCTLHYWYRKGKGNEFVILFHGAGCDHEMFEAQSDIFGDEYSVIIWDARGHGASKLENGKRFSFDDMYADVLSLFQVHKIEKAIVIGQSMGGNLAQELAYRQPELIDKLILIDCTNNNQKLSSFEKLALKSSRAIFCLYPWKTLIRQSATACGKQETTQNYVKKCFEQISKEDFIDIMMSLSSCLHEDADYRFAQPVLLLCGEADMTGNIKKARRAWPENDSNCKLKIIKNASHNSNQDNPEEVNDAIVQFLGQLD